MSSSRPFTERRALPRYRPTGLHVEVRRSGRLARTRAEALDFNRFGIGILIDQPIAKDKRIFISLRHGPRVLENVVGVVHNCIPHNGRFRCGIQFRTRSETQFDKDWVERVLLDLECVFNDARGEPNDEQQALAAAN